MIAAEQSLVVDQDKLRRLKSKAYRDSYLHSQVRSWIGYQFQAIRKKFGLSQIQMAERTGKTQSVISRLESTEYGKVSVQTLLDVASSLDVALLVQFVSYPEFLDRTRDKSEKSMQPDTILESLFVRDAVSLLSNASTAKVSAAPAGKIVSLTAPYVGTLSSQRSLTDKQLDYPANSPLLPRYDTALAANARFQQ